MVASTSAAATAAAPTTSIPPWKKALYTPPMSIMSTPNPSRAMQKLAGVKNFPTATLILSAVPYLNHHEYLRTRQLSKYTNHTFTIIEMLRRRPCEIDIYCSSNKPTNSKIRDRLKVGRKEMAERLEALQSGKSFQKKVKDACNALNTVEWNQNNPVFMDPDFDLYIWYAFTQRKFQIGKTQFVTASIFHEASKAPQDKYLAEGSTAKTMTCFNDQLKINKEAQAIIEGTFANSEKGFMTDAQIKAFWESVGKLPLSERQFLTLSTKEDFKSCVTGNMVSMGITILSCFKKVVNSQKPVKSRKQKLSNPFTVSKTIYTQIVPSFGMMLAFLKVKFGVQEKRINPVFGISTGSDMKRNIFEGMQDMAISNRWSVNLKADNHPAPSILYMLHDFYHAIIASGMPKDHAIFMIHLVLYMEKKRNEEIIKLQKNNATPQEIDSKKLEYFGTFNRLTDLEPIDFRDDLRKKRSVDALFWATLILSITFGLESSHEKFVKKSIADNIPADKIKSDKSKFLAKSLQNITDLVIDYIFTQKKGIQAEVTAQGLIEQAAFIKNSVKDNGLKTVSNLLVTKLTAFTKKTAGIL